MLHEKPLQAISWKGLSREGFKIAHDISAYSFPAMAKAALPFLREDAALLTLTYLGAVKVVPNYNTMGLAKASLEASVRYLADSSGAQKDPCEWHQCGSDQNAGSQWHQRLWQNFERRCRYFAHSSQCDH